MTSIDPASLVDRFIFCAASAAGQEDVVLGEGQAMVFVPPDDILKLDLMVSAAYVFPLFLRSQEYAGLVSEAIRLRNVL